MAFRQSYKLVSKQAIYWFPGHMGKGMKQIEQKLRLVDCIIEVHDARIPFSGRNPDFKKSIGDIKPHILVFNKKDLTEVRDQRNLIQKIKETEGIEHVIFTNCKDQQCRGIRKILPLASKLIANSDRFNRMGEKDYCTMIVGVPNVGKSSLLNVLRNVHLKKKSASKVGGVAGITRSVMEKIKISDNPLMYIIDTPGILEPCIVNDEMGMKLALVGCLQDHLVGEELIADYLLYWLNSHGIYTYVEMLGLKKPTDNIAEVLIANAHRLGVKRKVRKIDGQVVTIPDMIQAASQFVREFRRGGFGLLNLDLRYNP